MRLLRPILLALAVQLSPSVGDAQQSADRIYVRRIEFHGITRTNDEVLRRELRQIEGAFLDPAALEGSRIYLERLPSVERAALVVAPVPAPRTSWTSSNDHRSADTALRRWWWVLELASHEPPRLLRQRHLFGSDSRSP